MPVRACVVFSTGSTSHTETGQLAVDTGRADLSVQTQRGQEVSGPNLEGRAAGLAPTPPDYQPLARRAANSSPVSTTASVQSLRAGSMRSSTGLRSQKATSVREWWGTWPLRPLLSFQVFGTLISLHPSFPLGIERKAQSAAVECAKVNQPVQQGATSGNLLIFGNLVLRRRRDNTVGNRPDRAHRGPVLPVLCPYCRQTTGQPAGLIACHTQSCV